MTATEKPIAVNFQADSCSTRLQSHVDYAVEPVNQRRHRLILYFKRSEKNKSLTLGITINMHIAYVTYQFALPIFTYCAQNWS